MASNSAYGAAAAEIADLFVDYLEGDATRPALALSRETINPISRNAIEKSLEFFGYAADSCTYATLLPRTAADSTGIELDPQALFALIEGLDPLLVIATDSDATSTLAKAYRIDLPTFEAAPTRIFGRPAATFQNLTSLLQSTPGKQSAWQTLKSLNK